MRNKVLLIITFLLLVTFVTGQKTISGTFPTAKDYFWIMAYYLKSGSQVYVVETRLKNGKFTLNMPADAKPGIYRLTYAIPQEEFYFDVIYNEDEAINLIFNTDGVSYTKSKENLLLNSYTKKINS